MVLKAVSKVRQDTFETAIFMLLGDPRCNTYYFVSLCNVTLFKRGEYFLSSNLSGLFRLFFVVI